MIFGKLSNTEKVVKTIYKSDALSGCYTYSFDKLPSGAEITKTLLGLNISYLPEKCETIISTLKMKDD